VRVGGDDGSGGDRVVLVPAVPGVLEIPDGLRRYARPGSAAGISGTVRRLFLATAVDGLAVPPRWRLEGP
jgi:hypothetical protein